MRGQSESPDRQSGQLETADVDDGRQVGLVAVTERQGAGIAAQGAGGLSDQKTRRSRSEAGQGGIGHDGLHTRRRRC